jgi:hypothetical protein
MRRHIAILCAVVVAGCAAPKTYYHPGKTQVDFDRDSYDCQQDAYRHASDIGAAGNPFIVRDAYHDCMLRKHGYTVGPPAQKT